MPKKVLRSFQNFTNADMSQSSLTSPVTDIEFIDNIGLQLVFTGTPTGTFDVQISTNYNAMTGVAGDWTSLAFTSAPVASGSASNIYIDLNQLSAPFIRVIYTKTGGTGTLNGYITGKEV